MPDPTRRSFLGRTTTLGLGLAWPFGVPQRAKAALAGHGRRATADAVIQIHLDGGLSHLDTFDPKPDAPAEVRGPFGTVASRLDGEPLSQLLTRTAAVADKLVLVRAMTHTEADHDRGAHSVLTGHAPSPALVFPGFGAVVAHELGGRNDLPPYVCVPAPNSSSLGAGYLGTAFAPFAVGGDPASPRFRVRDLGRGRGDQARHERRKQLLHDLDAGVPALLGADQVEASAEFYRQAWALLESEPARAAFDLQAEPDARKDRYGRTSLGMSCLLARRLVAAGVRYVVATLGGFDHHNRIQASLPGRMNQVDQAFAALLADLDAEGMLERTLVLLTTEFGRTPRLNGDAGRDHWSRVFSIAMAGGGLRRGVVLGRSNATGAEPEQDPVRPADVAATVFAALGIDPERRLLAPGDRPIDLVRDGRLLREVLA